MGVLYVGTGYDEDGSSVVGKSGGDGGDSAGVGSAALNVMRGEKRVDTAFSLKQRQTGCPGQRECLPKWPKATTMVYANLSPKNLSDAVNLLITERTDPAENV